MNKSGQLIMGVFFSLIVFLILWFMFFAKWLNQWSQQFIIDQSLTGLEAFLVSTMNVWVLIGVSIGVLVSVYFGGSN